MKERKRKDYWNVVVLCLLFNLFAFISMIVLFCTNNFMEIASCNGFKNHTQGETTPHTRGAADFTQD